MALNPSILLSYNGPKAASIEDLQQERAAIEDRNRRTQTIKDLQSIDMNDPEAVASVIAKTDPIKAQEYRMQAGQQKAQQTKAQQESRLKGLEYAQKQAASLTALYDSMVNSGIDPETAKQKLQPTYQQAGARAKQMFPELEVSEQFDPDMMRQFALESDGVLKEYQARSKPDIMIAPNGQVINKNDPSNIGKTFAEPKPLKANPTRERYSGNTVIQEEMQPDGTWKQIGSGARFKQTPDTVVNVGGKEQFKNERDLRNDFQGLPTTKGFREVQTAYDQITTALKNPSAANDLAAATKFMKLLDPGSVVRESELGMAMEATGKLDQLSNYFNRLKTGQKLTESQRKDFSSAAADLYKAAASRYDQTADEYRKIGEDYGLDAERVAKKSGVDKEVSGKPTLPKIGTVKNGYAYIGGDPSKESSWKKAK